MTGYSAPASSKTKWTTLTQSALQMNECNTTWHIANVSFESASNIKERSCHHTVFVHDSKGNDLFDGTWERPLKTIHSSVILARNLRTKYGNDHIVCITIRGGTYYLGTNATITSSQVGAIALTSNDSNLVIENYPDEKVVLSGGTLLQLKWSVHTKTAAGDTIMKAQVPDSVNLDQFNELYIDGTRAIVAKYPNGDPATEGLFIKNPGYSFNAQSWVPPVHIPSANIIVQLSSRNRSGLSFPNYQIGVGGSASVFNPSSSF